jgi:hypothetical protein
LHTHFATAFAGVAPDEDFVETYRLLVIKNAKQVDGTALLQTLTLTITPETGSPFTVTLSDLTGGTRPAEKFTCIQPLVL